MPTSIAIAFASKHGATAEIARRIADGLGPGARLFDLAQGRPDLSKFDAIVLGTAVYAGTPLRTMRTFARSLAPDAARLGLFVSGMETDPAVRDQEVQAAFPQALLDRAVAAAFLGGRFRFAGMNVAERLVVRRIAGTRTDVEAIDDQAIEDFILRMRPDGPDW
ncbi:flavodoxin domain-containing protein [Schaalia naturae]|jgi:menaquinone-dependent protoporphyrinogen oxidase|uniref:Flavodoxin domain-containing protein n=1 Tax=Schaalia naturae TaxID=635203 RepID=A0ABW2SKM7_9ACTO